MYTLIVIDMQSGFKASKNEALKEVIKEEIREAKKNKADIIFAEFAGHGNTLDDIFDLADGYERRFRVYKRIDDGSNEIQQETVKQGCMIKRFRVVGINTDYCVYYTIKGLRSRFPSSIIEAVKNGCGSSHDHIQGLRYIRQLPQIAVV